MLQVLRSCIGVVLHLSVARKAPAHTSRSGRKGFSMYQQVGLGIQGVATVRRKPPKGSKIEHKQKLIWGLCYETECLLCILEWPEWLWHIQAGGGVQGQLLLDGRPLSRRLEKGSQLGA